MEYQAEIIRFIQSVHSPVLDALFIFITNFGSSAFYFIAIGALYWGKDRDLGMNLIRAMVLSIYINVILKEMTMVPRPIGYPGIRSIYVISAGGYSFPSGHAQGTSTFWSMIVYQFRQRRINLLILLLVLFVGLSRLYLGVHWPIDVLVGTALGIIITALFNTFAGIKIKLPPSADMPLAILWPLLLLTLFPHPDIYKMMGMLAGAQVGFLLDEGFGAFEPEYRGKLKSLAKYCIGAGGFCALYLALGSLLPKVGAYDALRYFAFGLWLTLVAPWIFKRLDL